jgi:uronate dehydrogenase
VEFQTILVTGMSGLIGEIARRQLGYRYNLVALNRRRVPGVPCHQLDIRDLPAIEPVFREADAVIHLAGIKGPSCAWEDLRDVNITGTYNVFEASRRAEVKRILYASSGGVVGGYERAFPYSALTEGRYDTLPQSWRMLTHRDPPRPRNAYSCSKLWGEALAQFYSDAYGISILCLRFGRVTSLDRPQDTLEDSIYCSQRDAGHMIERALQAPESVHYDVFFVQSNNRYGYRDLSHAEEVLGFRPVDSAQDHPRE